MVAEGLPVRACCRVLPGAAGCCRVLAVSESGFYAWRGRPPSARAARRMWLTDTIAQIHAASNGVYGSPGVHAELRLARGIIVGHGTVERLMRHAGLKGLPYSRTRRPLPQVSTAADLVDRDFHRDAPNRLWVTDITEHPTREGNTPPERARSTAAWFWTPTPAASSAGPSTTPRPALWSPTPSPWPSRTDAPTPAD
jgi:hypothetical protein